MIVDLVLAHQKALLALLSLVLIQVVDSDTADWIITAVGSALVYLKSNNQDSVRRVYRKASR